MSCLRLRKSIMIASIPMICRDYGRAHKPASRMMQARTHACRSAGTCKARLYVAHPERLAVPRGFQLSKPIRARPASVAPWRAGPGRNCTGGRTRSAYGAVPRACRSRMRKSKPPKLRYIRYDGKAVAVRGAHIAGDPVTLIWLIPVQTVSCSSPGFPCVPVWLASRCLRPNPSLRRHSNPPSLERLH